MGKVWNQLKQLGDQSVIDRDNFINNIFSGVKDIWNNITGRTSKELAEKNFNLQQEQFDYQKQLNDLMMEREDTAYQRAVKDANAAGLSSLSVNGGAAASAGTSANPPQVNDYASDNFNRGMNLLNTITQFQNNITQQIISKKRAEADINKTNAETRDIEAKTDLFTYTLAGQKDLFDKEYIDKLRNYDFNSKYGIFNNADPYEKYAILNQLNKSQYSDIIQTNQFNKIGLLFGLLSKIGNKLSDGKINSIDDVLDSAGNLIKPDFINSQNILPDVSISNNKLNLDNTKLFQWLMKHPFEKKEDNNAQKTQNSIESIKDRNKKKTIKTNHKSGKFK